MNPIKSLYRLKYGVRGALKPPLGTQRGFAYFWKFVFWRAENAIYAWTGLPDKWFTERRHNRLRAVMDGLAADFLATADEETWNEHTRAAYRYCANQIRAALEEDEKQ